MYKAMPRVMKIGFLVNPNCAISGMGNGILKQAAMWAEGLRGLGHEVHFIGPNQDGSIRPLKEFDVVHFFQHGHWLKGFWNGAQEGQKWFYSPILDSTASIRMYAALAKVPLQHYLLSFGPRLLRDFCMRSTVSVRSAHERSYLEAIAPDAQIETHPIAVTLQDGESQKPLQRLPSKFVLFVGNVSAERKNVHRLVQACDAVGIPLVLAGIQVKSAYMSRVESVIKSASIPVHCLGFLKEEELRWLYQNCSVFCLPSLVEGVGQVAMEALYFGARVVVTNIGGAPDYFGEFAEYVNPHSIDSIQQALTTSLKRDEIEVQAARAHLEQFSIKSTASRLAASYQAELDA